LIQINPLLSSSPRVFGSPRAATVVAREDRRSGSGGLWFGCVGPDPNRVGQSACEVWIAKYALVGASGSGCDMISGE